jgi:gamma-glutamylcyclotransferase (GGCT)/AIG2-like uncharacterized protein YtfP
MAQQSHPAIQWTGSALMIPGVFVYGTLKPGESNHPIARQAGRFTHYNAYLEDYLLYHLEPEGYPAMVPGSGRVYGSVLVYEDIAAALPVLDDLEGLGETPPLYRRALAVAKPTGERVWTYLYSRPERLREPGALLLSTGSWPA